MAFKKGMTPWNKFKMKSLDSNNDDFGYVVGTILGDGCLAKDRIQMGVIDFDFAKEFQKKLENCFNKKANINIKIIKNTKRKNQFIVTLCSVEIVNYMKKLLKSLEWINFKSKSFKRGFLRGMFDSEGSIDMDSRTFCFSNANEKILSLFRNLCLDFGIKVTKIRGKGSRKHIDIYPIKDRYLFYKSIGITIERKRKLFENEIIKRKKLNERYKSVLSLNKLGLGYRKINKIYPELSGRTILHWYKGEKTPYCNKFMQKISLVNPLINTY